jgi:limonene-1,2-epoxide hydrolase
MKVTTATASVDDMGPLTRIALAWAQGVEERATAKGCSQEDWDALSDLVAVDEFKRVGAYMEVMGWKEYVKFLTQWAGSTRFESTVFRISEIGNIVVQEIEERHYKGDDFIRKNVIAVYEFDEKNRIRHLDIYEQAKDTGRWIVEAAQASLDPSPAP